MARTPSACTAPSTQPSSFDTLFAAYENAASHGLSRAAAIAALTGTRVLRHWGLGLELPVRSRQTDLFERFGLLGDAP